MLYTYWICLVKDDGYFIVFPDFHTFLHSDGDESMALSRARTALSSYLKENIQNAAPIPLPTARSDLDVNVLGEMYGFCPEFCKFCEVTVGITDNVYQYPACFYRGEHGYCAVFPDFEDIKVSRLSRAEVSAAASVSLRSSIKKMLGQGVPIPKPTERGSVSAKNVGDALNIDFENAYVDMISVVV